MTLVTRLVFSPALFILTALSLVAPAQAEMLAAPTSQVPPCVIGTWRVADLEGMFRGVMADTGVQLDGITGEIRLAVSAGGVYEMTYQQVTLTTTMSDLGASTMVFEGYGRGALRELRPGALMGNTTESSITVTFNSGDLSFSNTSTLPTGEEQVEFNCETSRLRFYVSVPVDETTERNQPVDFIRAN